MSENIIFDMPPSAYFFGYVDESYLIWFVTKHRIGNNFRNFLKRNIEFHGCHIKFMLYSFFCGKKEFPTCKILLCLKVI